ncbi:hypothetical protein PG993_010968 [Apiospora rasikravindrae]|uniref:Zn(2)-C6 fungal-type domain-containing protein n=1 Tax=Apiospora rasikravindrae TaxID=990691 RepID=A0ABR1SCX4_9PEZI
MDQLENQVSDLRYLTQNGITPLAETQASFSPSALGSPSSVVAGNNSALSQRAASTTMGHPDLANQTPSAPVGGNSGHGGTKRKSIGDSPGSGNGNSSKQQRSKRNRYISIACNECKRRKIKCNGETPCQRCGNLNLQCLYAPNCCSTNFKDSDEYKDMANTVTRLQEQVETLFNNMNSLRSETLRLAPINDRVLPIPPSLSAGTPSSSSPSAQSLARADLSQLRDAGFRGPTSANFNLDIARTTLHKLGYSNMDGSTDGGHTVPEDTPAVSPAALVPRTMESQTSSSRPLDPLWEYDQDEMIRLCRVHEEEIGIMYPVIQIESVINHVKFICSWKDAVKKSYGQPTQGQGENIVDTKSLLLKIVLCIGLVIEAHGTSERATRLFESMRPRLERMLITDPSDVSHLPILALCAGYRFLTNDEILSWRIIGQVARHCIELGLHRRETIMRIKDDTERRDAIHTFWTAYILDRRWSFGTGLPYVLQDGDIDSQLPGPSQDEHPFLHAMISYSQLGAKVWEYVRHFDRPVDLRPAELEHLDGKIKQWYTNAPADAQLELPDWESMPRHFVPSTAPERGYDLQRQQIWTYLRLNQMRLWLYTPVLHTHSSIIENMTLAERAVRLAKNCIIYLTNLHKTTSLYRRSQVFYHQFLSSAIAVLFLASCHAPLNFSSSCRDEFYMALELVKDLSSKSDVSRRLWRTIASLKEVAPRLGLAQDEDPHSSAALTMAGLATGQHIPSAPVQSPHKAAAPQSYTRAAPPPSQQQQAHTVATSPAVPPNGWHLSNEMSKIFEGYMGMNGFDERATSTGPSPEDDGPPPTPFGVGVDKPGNVYQHFRDMF